MLISDQGKKVIKRVFCNKSASRLPSTLGQGGYVSICLHFEYSPELPNAPKPKVNEYANNGWHIPLHFLVPFFPKQQQQLPPSPSAFLALCTVQFPHQDFQETCTALDLRYREVAARCFQHYYSNNTTLPSANKAEHMDGHRNTFPTSSQHGAQLQRCMAVL